MNARQLERDRAQEWIREAEGDGVSDDFGGFLDNLWAFQ